MFRERDGCQGRDAGVHPARRRRRGPGRHAKRVNDASSFSVQARAGWPGGRRARGRGRSARRLTGRDRRARESGAAAEPKAATLGPGLQKNFCKERASMTTRLRSRRAATSRRASPRAGAPRRPITGPVIGGAERPNRRGGTRHAGCRHSRLLGAAVLAARMTGATPAGRTWPEGREQATAGAAPSADRALNKAAAMSRSSPRVATASAAWRHPCGSRRAASCLARRAPPTWPALRPACQVSMPRASADLAFSEDGRVARRLPTNSGRLQAP